MLPSSSYLDDLRIKYFRHRDPTEYSFAKECFGTWAEWEEFCSKDDVAPLIGLWRKELEVRLRSESLARILEAAQGDTRDALAANKYIFETLSSKGDKGNGVGRPSKELILKEAKFLEEDRRLKEEAYQRIIINEPSLKEVLPSL